MRNGRESRESEPGGAAFHIIASSRGSEKGTHRGILRKPSWLKIGLGGGASYAGLNRMLEDGGLHTICQSGRCPNQGECWSDGTAAFMILGGICTRRCRFCATPTGAPHPPDPDEPVKLARVVRSLELKHAVFTSVDRDDLPDGGASHWVRTIERVREMNPNTTVEALLPDFMGKSGALECVAQARPEIAAHNVETVARLTPSVRSRAQYCYSLSVLEKLSKSGLIVKSGIMLGLGERPEEIEQTLRDIHSTGCSVITVGQYLQPSRSHHPVMRYVTPAEFEEYGALAYSIGYRYAESGPLVRSSFHADRALRACGVLKDEPEGATTVEEAGAEALNLNQE